MRSQTDRGCLRAVRQTGVGCAQTDELAAAGPSGSGAAFATTTHDPCSPGPYLGVAGAIGPEGGPRPKEAETIVH